MVELLKDLPASVVIALSAALLTLLYAILKAAAWFFQEWWHDRKEIKKSQTDAILANTLALVKLETQVEQLTKLLQIIPKLERDISSAHVKIREIGQE